MRTLKETLVNLSSEKQKLLMYAFDNNISQYVEYSAGKFLGVHINKNQKNLKILKSVGSWAMGEIK